MKLAKKMYLKMKEDEAKQKAKEEESNRKAKEVERGKMKVDYSDDLVELFMSKAMKRVSLNTEGPSSKSKGNKFHRVQFDYSHNFVPNFSWAPLESYQLLVS
jgi:hypothetical protein